MSTLCTQCGPGHDRGDGRCDRHDKVIGDRPRDLAARLVEHFDTIAEALGDAYAYRNGTDGELEDYEVETLERYQAAADALGIKLS
jgi:hypothetical protein